MLVSSPQLSPRRQTRELTTPVQPGLTNWYGQRGSLGQDAQSSQPNMATQQGQSGLSGLLGAPSQYGATGIRDVKNLYDTPERMIGEARQTSRRERASPTPSFSAHGQIAYSQQPRLRPCWELTCNAHGLLISGYDVFRASAHNHIGRTLNNDIRADLPRNDRGTEPTC